MASGFIGNEVPRKGLRVRVPCPPLQGYLHTLKLNAASPDFCRLAAFFYLDTLLGTIKVYLCKATSTRV